MADRFVLGDEVVSSIAEQLKVELADIARVDVVRDIGFVADLSIIPLADGAATISVVGMKNEFIFQIPHDRMPRWELANTLDGLTKLQGLIRDTIEGRMPRERRFGRRRAFYSPYSQPI